MCDYPDDLDMRVSHETIYRTLFVQARGALRKELTSCLRTGRTQRRPQMRSEQSGAGRLQNMDAVPSAPSPFRKVRRLGIAALADCVSCFIRDLMLIVLLRFFGFDCTPYNRKTWETLQTISCYTVVCCARE